MERKGNLVLGISTVMSIGLIVLASLNLTGFSLAFIPFILPIAAINVALFIFATYREFKRDNDASILLNCQILRVFDSYLDKREQEAGYQNILRENVDIKALDENTQKELMQSYITRAYISTLLREYSNTTYH